MELFSMISKWFWVLCILVMLINAAVFRFRANKHIKKNPSLETGYKKIIKGFVMWGSIPWIVMGIGCTVGGIPSVWNYFNPSEGDPYGLAFFGSVFLIWISGSYWIFFKGGALELVNHPGIFNYDIKSPTILKLIWIACLLGGIAGVLMMYKQNIPLPQM
jgi:hypothetical protein